MKYASPGEEGGNKILSYAGLIKSSPHKESFTNSEIVTSNFNNKRRIKRKLKKKRKNEINKKQKIKKNEITNQNDNFNSTNTNNIQFNKFNLGNNFNPSLEIQKNSNRQILQMDITELIKLLLKQFEFFLQLTIQNILLSNDQSLVYRCYWMLYSFYTTRQGLINYFKLPSFPVNFNFCEIFNNGKPISIYPQISFFQAPVLDILPIFAKFINKTFSVDEVNNLLKEFIPYINSFYMPMKKNNQNFILKSFTETGAGDNLNSVIDITNITNDIKNVPNEIPLILNEEEKVKPVNEVEPENNNFSEIIDSSNKDATPGNNVENKGAHVDNKNTLLNKKRKKFDNIYDNLLMIGLMCHGKKNIDLVQQLWVNSRSSQEIRHRIKNLTCKRAPENTIKKWKNMNEVPLTKDEFYSFIKGIEWFGVKKKWNVISRYFLPERHPEYLEK